MVTLKQTSGFNLYQCSHCGSWFLNCYGDVKMSCAVLHAPGECCHYGERGLSSQQAADISRLIGEVVKRT